MNFCRKVQRNLRLCKDSSLCKKCRANNAPPNVEILQPTNNYVFKKGEKVAFVAQVSDDKTPVPQLTFDWEFRLIHSMCFLS
jgi:hypothetical protein